MRFIFSTLPFLSFVVSFCFSIYFFDLQDIEQIFGSPTEYAMSHFKNPSLNSFNFSSAYIFFRKIFEVLGKKDAKVFKDSRYNFASILGGAKILEKNLGCLYEKSVLDDNPDKYSKICTSIL